MRPNQEIQKRFSNSARFYLISGLVVILLILWQIFGSSGLLLWLAGWVPKPLALPFEKLSKGSKSVMVGVGRLRSLYVENGEMKTKIKELEVKLAALNAVEAENQVLKNTLEFKNRSPLTLVSCTVLARDPEGLTFTLLLSCGRQEGVEEGQAVIAEGYLVGKIVLSKDKISTARLLLSPSLSLDAKVLGRQVSGVVKGSYGAGIVLDLVSSTSGVTAGDLVASAGINQQIPPDLLLGTVSEVVRTPGNLFDQISVSSPVDLRDLRFVQVAKQIP